MKTMYMRLAVLAALVAVGLTAPAGASVLQFDLGGSTYTGNASPAHAVGAALATETTWNFISTGATEPYTGLKWGDNTNATGVSLDLGLGFEINAAGAWGYDATQQWTEPVASAFYANTLAKDFIYDANGVGFRVKGLPAGSYGVYASGLVTNRVNSQLLIGIGVNPGTSQFADPVRTYAGTLTSWVAGTTTTPGNYAYEVVTISGPNDYIGVISTSTMEAAPELNFVQIVPVPEPATMSLLAVGGIGMVLRRKKA